MFLHKWCIINCINDNIKILSRREGKAIMESALTLICDWTCVQMCKLAPIIQEYRKNKAVPGRGSLNSTQTILNANSALACGHSALMPAFFSESRRLESITWISNIEYKLNWRFWLEWLWASDLNLKFQMQSPLWKMEFVLQSHQLSGLFLFYNKHLLWWELLKQAVEETVPAVYNVKSPCEMSNWQPLSS